MVNPRFAKPIAKLGQKEFFEMFKEINRTRPKDYQFEQEELVHPSKLVKDRDVPFVPGDRVQIIKGKDKGKVGLIVQRMQPSSNSFLVQGAGVKHVINPIEAKNIDKDNWMPVAEYPRPFDMDSLRLVSKIKEPSGKEVDVVIHSIELGPEKYNAFTNRHERVRYAKHDHSIQIPYPAQERPKPVPEERASLTTAAPVVDVRSHYVVSAVDCPMPIGMIDQVTNLNSRTKRARYAKKLTAAQISAASAPEMPLAPRTQKILADIAALQKPEHPAFSPEMAAFLDAEIKKGLESRVAKEAQALDSYK